MNNIKRLQLNEIQNCFSFWDFENNLEKRKRIESEIVNERRKMYAYMLNGEYIAGMSLYPLENNIIYLSYLVVKGEYRNQGIGTKMIKYACQISKRYSYIMLNVDEDNPVAKRLYKKLGFVAVETDSQGKTKMRMEL